jgi:hypothetical protein
MQLNVTAYLDGCPSDWLQRDQPAQWHTIALVATPNVYQFEAEQVALPKLVGESDQVITFTGD